MFPFDLQGPEFLFFFVVFGASVVAALHLFRSDGESGDPGSVHLSDPYLIATLTGGAGHVLRVASLALIDRRLLSVSNDKLQTASSNAQASVRNEVEKQLLRHFNECREAKTVFGNSDLERRAVPYQEELTRLGLLPDSAVKRQRELRFWLAMLVLEGVAIIKLFVAMSQGRRNIGYLMVLMIVFGLIGAAVTFRKRTRRGDEMVADLRSLFSDLKDRRAGLRAGQSTSEMALLAAVFGAAVLPQTVYPYTKKLYPKAADAAGSSGCGSACGSSCGSSCGGGGCGGGCGGCGS